MQARSTDTTLPTLISAGAEDIAAGQAKVVALLQSIIGQQNSAAAAAEDAAEALAAIQNLQSQQAAAQQAIALSLTNSISAIQVGFKRSAPFCMSSTSCRQPLLEMLCVMTSGQPLSMLAGTTAQSPVHVSSPRHPAPV